MNNIIPALDKIAELSATERVLSGMPLLNATVYPGIRAYKARPGHKLKTFAINSALSGGGSVAGVMTGEALLRTLLKNKVKENGIAANLITLGLGIGAGMAGAEAGSRLTDGGR